KHGLDAIPRAITLEGEESESPFEEEVYEALREKGLEIRKQIGVSGYRIDLGVVDPSHPGSFMLGIECDGKTYHSFKTARDRDRLRQQVLEGLGWRIHRIWSTDWVQNRQAEIGKVLAAFERAKAISREAKYVVDKSPGVEGIPNQTSNESALKPSPSMEG
ncbi:MAG: DUF559 domain-containing protein, partial [Chloroflexota bacterium]|nr:DUF559 domain-containing protein [Chloroflexota bacterium]